MSLLDHLPHRVTFIFRTRSQDEYGGNFDEKTVLSTGNHCWRQGVSDSEMQSWQKRGITVTNKFYFASNPGLDERHQLKTEDDDLLYEVVSPSVPDATVGLGLAWRVMARRDPTGGAS